MNALAVFHDHGSGFLSGFLKPGFRHVFVAVQKPDYWMTLDAFAGIPEMDVVAPENYDLATYYREQGFTVVETTQLTVAPRSPFAIANCVGLVKAMLCIRSAAITPWGLYNHLRNRS